MQYDFIFKVYIYLRYLYVEIYNLILPLPSVKRPPCQKVVIRKYLIVYRQSNNVVGLRLFLEMGVSITTYLVPRAPLASLITSALSAPCTIGDFDMLLKSDSISRAPVAGASNIVQNCPILSQISPLRSNIATNRPKSPFKSDLFCNWDQQRGPKCS